MLCVLILCISGGTYCLKATPNNRFFEKLFMAILFTLRVSARNMLRGNRRRNTFRISFWCVWPGTRTLVFRLISQHTTYWTTATSRIALRKRKNQVFTYTRIWSDLISFNRLIFILAQNFQFFRIQKIFIKSHKV